MTIFIHELKTATVEYHEFGGGEGYGAFATMKLDTVDASGAAASVILVANAGSELYDRWKWKASAPDAGKGETL